MMWCSLTPPDPALSCGWMTVWDELVMLDPLTNDSSSQSVSVFNGLIHVLWGIYLLLSHRNLLFLVLWPLMPSDSSWTTISRWTADLTAMFIDYFYEARVCMAVENLWAAFCDVNQLSSGTMSRNSLRSWKYWKIRGLIRADWSWRKSPTGFIAFGWKSDVLFFRITIRKTSTVHCHSHPMAKNNCVYNREWDLENFLIIQRESDFSSGIIWIL